MAGKPEADLKSAAINFLNYFKDTEDEDKMGLISFCHGGNCGSAPRALTSLMT